MPGHEFVFIFENRGEAVGATLSHPHGQIYAFDRLPPAVALRVATQERHRTETGTCLQCELVATEEAAAARIVAANDAFLVSVPFAARWPYEVHIRARRHGVGRLADLKPDEQLELGRALADLVARYDGLFGHDLPYLMAVMEAPHDAPDWHLAFEFLPPNRGPHTLKVRASVETATGTFINDTVPEDSAAALARTRPDAPAWGAECLTTVEPVAVVASEVR
jgi:UDPglucose--hexose-1-phosphate uridylyltransferase